jgi:predicted transcriptional regulator
MNWIAVCIIAGVLLVAMFCPVLGQITVEYNIQVAADGSASWLITQSGTDIVVSPDNLTQFQNSVNALVQAVGDVTNRQMSVRGISMTSTISGSYGIVQYKFLWVNFSMIEGSEIRVGDVFNVADMFLRLQGDGEVVLNYPDTYELETVSPAPFSQDDSLQTMTWLGTKNLVGESTNIVLREKPTGFLEFVSRNSVLILGVVAIFAGSSLGIYLSRRRNKKKESGRPEAPDLSVMESDEEKIVKLLKSSQGHLRQSAIVEQCRFSKAKTSQILAALESKGTIRREKKGRDKIVVLAEKNEDANEK